MSQLPTCYLLPLFILTDSSYNGGSSQIPGPSWMDVPYVRSNKSSSYSEDTIINSYSSNTVSLQDSTVQQMAGV